MSRTLLSIFVLFLSTNLYAETSAYLTPLSYDCGGVIYNDEMAQYCANQEQTIENYDLWEIGSRFVYHSFEVISQNLTAEIEEDYDMVLMVNSAEVRSGSPGDFMPGQSMLVLKKASGARHFFKRNAYGVITGLKRGTKQLSQIIGQKHRTKISKTTAKNYGMPYVRKGLELVPVSTGSRSHLLSFSGIFQVNWGRSRKLPRRGWGNPMSNPLYLGYYYTKSNGARERITYAATHGTPKSNWDLLGKSRASHGCTRVHPAVMEDIRAHVESMPIKEVYEFNWNYELPTQDIRKPYAVKKPVLVMIFNGYEGRGL